ALGNAIDRFLYFRNNPGGDSALVFGMKIPNRSDSEIL
ncbi:MAG: hypothetical protein QG650_1026, partial [Patescibacteria group bacterium]|nr:hypothetical protein [Patescibacteria group bacterium]